MTSPDLPRSAVRRRTSIGELTATDLVALRASFLAMQQLDDDRGYGFWAGLHGLPLPITCQHGNPLFLPWHRAYLYFFEQFLLDQNPDARLPWWNWVRQVGIPPAYAVAELPDGTPNPLAAAPVTGIPLEQFARAGLPPVSRTFRRPDDPGMLPSAQQVVDVLAAPDFIDFTLRLEDLHNGVHVWVGGSMGLVPLAAFDPIFWAHHSMIDLLWWLWQLRHPNAGPDPALLDTALAPFPITVRQTLDITRLGYDYAAAASSARPGASQQGGAR